MATKTVTYADELVAAHDEWVKRTGSSLDEVVEGWLKACKADYDKEDADSRATKYDALSDADKAAVDAILG